MRSYGKDALVRYGQSYICCPAQPFIENGTANLLDHIWIVSWFIACKITKNKKFRLKLPEYVARKYALAALFPIKQDCVQAIDLDKGSNDAACSQIEGRIRRNQLSDKSDFVDVSMSSGLKLRANWRINSNVSSLGLVRKGRDSVIDDNFIAWLLNYET